MINTSNVAEFRNSAYSNLVSALGFQPTRQPERERLDLLTTRVATPSEATNSAQQTRNLSHCTFRQHEMAFPRTATRVSRPVVVAVGRKLREIPCTCTWVHIEVHRYRRSANRQTEESRVKSAMPQIVLGFRTAEIT
jgi:hypothetical protein